MSQTHLNIYLCTGDLYTLLLIWEIRTYKNQNPKQNKQANKFWVPQKEEAVGILKINTASTNSLVGWMDELFPGSNKLGHCKGLVSQATKGTFRKWSCCI